MESKTRFTDGDIQTIWPGTQASTAPDDHGRDDSPPPAPAPDDQGRDDGAPPPQPAPDDQGRDDGGPPPDDQGRDDT